LPLTPHFLQRNGGFKASGHSKKVDFKKVNLFYPRMNPVVDAITAVGGLMSFNQLRRQGQITIPVPYQIKPDTLIGICVERSL
jgi:hypothetical protein